ncbi:MAG: nucleoside deaminase [Ginsengibacter sp.]
MLNEEKFMKAAIALAETAAENGEGGPFGCVIVKNGKIVGEGYNKVISTNDPTAHAEIVAIRDACKNLNSFQLEECEVYTSCEPCPMCLGAIYWARPKAIYFGNTKEDAATIGFDDSMIYDEIRADLNARKIPAFNILREEANTTFVNWNEKDAKKHY